MKERRVVLAATGENRRVAIIGDGWIDLKWEYEGEIAGTFSTLTIEQVAKLYAATRPKKGRGK